MKVKNVVLPAIIIAVVCVLFGGIYFLTRNGNENKEKGNYLVELSGEQLVEKIDNKESFILLIVKTGCSYCELFEPVLEKILKENKIVAYSVDTYLLTSDQKKFLNNVASIEGTPTTVFITNGEEETVVNRLVGNVPRKTVIRRLSDLGYIEE